MARFILPTPESAIVFEYQRGASEAHDVRLAVLRARRDNPDAIEYRLFECGFSRALFVDVNGTFLDDEGTTAAAREAGFSFTPKLTTADYRTIILNLRGNTKDAQKLRTLARSYSFAPRAMPNLDRLVASVVKEHVSFSDLIQVAVSMVHEETGANGPAGGNKLQLKQTKSEINDWIRNRRACEKAFNQSEKVAQIRVSLAKYWKEEHELRLLGAEVHALHASKTVQLGSATDARNEAGGASGWCLHGVVRGRCCSHPVSTTDSCREPGNIPIPGPVSLDSIRWTSDARHIPWRHEVWLE